MNKFYIIPILFTLCLLPITTQSVTPLAHAEIRNSEFGGQTFLDSMTDLYGAFTKLKIKIHHIITQLNQNEYDINELQNKSQENIDVLDALSQRVYYLELDALYPKISDLSSSELPYPPATNSTS